jgi:hypothetical protein
MARSAFNIIADVHEEMGQPGLAYCLQVLSDASDRGGLDPVIQNAYDEFMEELSALAN